MAFNNWKAPLASPVPGGAAGFGFDSLAPSTGAPAPGEGFGNGAPPPALVDFHLEDQRPHQLLEMLLHQLQQEPLD
jgi:hypothetical protein